MFYEEKCKKRIYLKRQTSRLCLVNTKLRHLKGRTFMCFQEKLKQKALTVFINKHLWSGYISVDTIGNKKHIALNRKCVCGGSFRGILTWNYQGRLHPVSLSCLSLACNGKIVLKMTVNLHPTFTTCRL